MTHVQRDSGTEGQKTEDAELCGLAEVAVVQAADFGKLHDIACHGELDRSVKLRQWQFPDEYAQAA